MAYSIHQYADI